MPNRTKQNFFRFFLTEHGGMAYNDAKDKEKGAAMKKENGAAIPHKEAYLHFEKGAGYSQTLAAHFARQNRKPDGIHIPVDYINWHEAVEFLYVIQGEIHILRGDEIHHLHAGDIVAIDPYMLHAPLFPTEETDLFYVKVFPPFYRECEIPFDGICHTPVFRDAEGTRLFKELIALYENRSAPMFIPRFKGILLLLVAHLFEHYAGIATDRHAPGKKQLSLMIPAIEYIHDHVTEKPSIAEIAAAAHISESHLLHSFRAATGMSVLEYVNYLRFLYAKTLFATSTLSCGEVAAACGFTSVSYFSKEYTRRMGISPSAERKKSKEEKQKSAK